MSSPTDAAAGALEILDARPAPGTPREYHFPRFTRDRLDNGLEVIEAHVPGRPLLQAQLVSRDDGGGAASGEAPGLAGVTMLTARAMPEGTQRRGAIELVEAAERLGAELGAEAGWESLVSHIEVPRARLQPALELLAEMSTQPSFPADEVERLRDERLNDLAQGLADPRRRVERVFAETVYEASSPYARPLGGVEESVARIDRDALAARHAAVVRPETSTLIVCGDLERVPVSEAVAAAFGTWRGTGDPAEPDALSVGAHPAGPRVVLVDRPGAPQSEVRLGHVGLPRRIPDFHAVTVMNGILGGLFSSRLMQLLREQRGYTYGIYSGFDMRRGPGPFAVRCSVHTEVTALALGDILGELRRMREEPVTGTELELFRDYLVGVFPLRFETSAQVAAALAGVVAFDLPDDELDRYRPGIAGVSEDDVLQAARSHVRPAEMSIAIVGDAARVESDLRGAGHGPLTVVRDEDAA
jgi:zinc protease